MTSPGLSASYWESKSVFSRHPHWQYQLAELPFYYIFHISLTTGTYSIVQYVPRYLMVSCSLQWSYRECCGGIMQKCVVCVFMTAQLRYTIKQRTVLTNFTLILHTIITAHMFSSRRKDVWSVVTTDLGQTVSQASQTLLPGRDLSLTRRLCTTDRTPTCDTQHCWFSVEKSAFSAAEFV